LQTEVYKEKVDFQMTDRGSKVIRRKVDESVESAFGVLRKELINLALLNLTFKIRSLDKFLLNFLVLKM
jgi:hypothetical protein